MNESEVSVAGDRSEKPEKYTCKQKELQQKVIVSTVELGESPLKRRSFVINADIDLVSICLLLISLVSRLWRLGHPRNIVFDELHYGKYAALYVKRTFFFDGQPPLGKQLLALTAYLADFDGNSTFDRIGSAYAGETPVWSLRIVPALCGSFLVPTAYYIMLELGTRQITASGAALLILLDNALLTQSRFALMEGMLLQFSALGILCLLKYRRVRKRLFSQKWFIYLILTSVFVTCATCIKYVGFFSILLAIIIIISDYWKLLKDKSLSDRTMVYYLLVLIGLFVALPAAIYTGTFYVHLAILSKAGPHDNVMTSAFQASLEGGLASITKGQPLEVVHGSQITLRHTHGRACWMHSHSHVYPVRYADGRGSSHQQQVTCYSFKDVNNWWIVKRPERNDLVVSEPLDRIRNGEVIQLVHGLTSRALNSHDVAAPITPQNQEVSCYIDYNVSMPAENLWRVEIVNRETVGDVWHTIRSEVRLVHVNSSQALKFTGRQLPDWGFHQHEMATDRVIDQQDTVWNVEEHRYTKSADKKDRERELGLAEFVPTAPTQLSFWEKFWELHVKMFSVNQENVQDHLYSSDPYEWPLLTRGVAYWIQSGTNAQIHLLGNIAIWYIGTTSLVLYVAFMIFYSLRRQRNCLDVSPDVWNDFVVTGEVLMLGYLLHYLPYFFVEKTLFLHHYLPALFYKLLLTAAFIQHLFDILRLKTKTGKVAGILLEGCVAVWLVVTIYVYTKFSVFSYGHKALDVQQVMDLRWKDTWDFIVQRP